MNVYRNETPSAQIRYDSSSGRVPQEAGDGRLFLSALTDLLVGLLVGLVVFFGVLHNSVPAPAVLGCVLAVSFVNHVLGTVLFRGSAGKLTFGLRAVRAVDGRRCGFRRAVGRWLLGFVLVGLMVVVDEGGTIGEAAGVRVIRRRDERRRR